MFEKHLHALQKAVAASDVDAMLLTSTANSYYVSSFSCDGGFILVTADAAVLATDFRYLEECQRKVKGCILVSNAKTAYPEILADYVAQWNIHNLGYETSMAVSTFRTYEKALAERDVCWTEADSIPFDLRRVKDAEEIRRITAAQRIAEAALERLLTVLRPGMTERQAATELDYYVRCFGADGPGFTTIAVSGENGSLCHGRPTDRVLRKGDFLTLDFGAVLNGYRSDMTRTVAIGEPDEEMKRVYDIVLRAQKAAIAYAKAGVIGKDMDMAARRIIIGEGYGDYFGHGTGHGVGIMIHDTDGCSPRNERALPAGTVTSVEPGIYLPGRFGVRIEDMVLLNENGCENLTLSPKELIVL